MDYVTVKWLHIVSSTLLFGTGIGSAYYMLVASLNAEPRSVYLVVRYVVIADWLFTATSGLLQPLTGFYLAYLAGWPFTTRWIFWSTILYLIAGACWLPVVWLQYRMRDSARTAAAEGTALPLRYWRFFRIWVALGVPAFASLVVAFYLMVAKPA